LVESVSSSPPPGTDTLVRLSCIEDDALGDATEVLWEREVDAQIVADAGWTRIGERGFDEPGLFAAYLNTIRWNTVTATDPTLFQAPFRAGIEVLAYQLEPLRKALRLPRVNLFIADDVGLGKTIEAGLILRELMLRQRVQRVVVAAPPSVVPQWREELEQRFGLTFEVYDRGYVQRKRMERGYGINPWTTHSRFIISHSLLSDESYAAGLRDWLGESAPGTLLILDEAHHAAPASGSRYHTAAIRLNCAADPYVGVADHREARRALAGKRRDCRPPVGEERHWDRHHCHANVDRAVPPLETTVTTPVWVPATSAP